jgi:hypothetical protein
MVAFTTQVIWCHGNIPERKEERKGETQTVIYRLITEKYIVSFSLPPIASWGNLLSSAEMFKLQSVKHLAIIKISVENVTLTFIPEEYIGDLLGKNVW